jgi:hypothetical protein
MQKEGRSIKINMPRRQSELRMGHPETWVKRDNIPENAYCLPSDMAKV